MSYIFNGCNSLVELDLSNFVTSKVTNINGMFQNCTSLTTLDFRNLNLSKMPYTTSGANYKYNCSNMFTNCTALTELRLDNCNNTTLLMINLDRQAMSYGGYKQYYAGLPTYEDGSVHNMYFKESNWSSSTSTRKGWTINYVPEE
jgi:surface protein